MNHVDFMPYHNRHIQFSVNNGPIMSGVLLDLMEFREDGKWSTNYTFVPSPNMREFQTCTDNERKKQLSSKVDIKDITRVELVRW